MKMQAKAITIRVSTAEFHTLSAQAEEQKTSTTKYVTSLVKNGLQGRLEDDRLAALEARLTQMVKEEGARVVELIQHLAAED